MKDFHDNNPLFVAYLLTTIDFQSHSGKSGVPGVNRNDLYALEVEIPATADEQKAIASTLSDIDNLLASLDRLIAKKRDLKQATMQQIPSNVKAGNIRLNTELVKKPKDLLEYVLVHEMAHLLEANHSDRFTAILDTHYPTWREARAELNALPLPPYENSIISEKRRNINQSLPRPSIHSFGR